MSGDQTIKQINSIDKSISQHQTVLTIRNNIWVGPSLHIYVYKNNCTLLLLVYCVI